MRGSPELEEVVEVNKFPERSLRSCPWVNVGVDLSTSTCKFPPQRSRRKMRRKRDVWNATIVSTSTSVHMPTHKNNRRSVQLQPS